MFLFDFSKRRISLQWTETSTFIILPFLQLLFMQKTDQTVAASFQTKDSILRQLHFVIMYEYILMRVMIIEKLLKKILKIVPVIGKTPSATLIHLIWRKTNKYIILLHNIDTLT